MPDSPSPYWPCVSIIIPCYKQAQFLAEAIDSALAQTYPHVEVVVVNDGSPDNTADVCKRYGNRIRYVEQENKGVSEARNAGIRAAIGEYILPLDADDKIDPSFLAETVPVLRDNPQVGFVYTDVVEFGQVDFRQAKAGLGGRTWDIVRLLVQPYLACSALYRKTDWAQVGGYRSEFVHAAEDTDFWLSLVELGKVGYYVQKPLFFYRRHGPNTRSSQPQGRASAETYARIIQLHRGLFEQYWPEVLAAWAKRYQEAFAYIRKVEPLLEDYYRLRPGRLEKLGVPLPLARALHNAAKFFHAR